jgi:recombination protein RecT
MTTTALTKVDQFNQQLTNMDNEKLICNLIQPDQADEFKRNLIMAVNDNNALIECDPKSLIVAAANIANLGLSIYKQMAHAYIIPYRNNKKGITEAQLQMGYKGLIYLARQSKIVENIDSHIVYSNDVFSYEYGNNAHLRHKPALDNRGKKIAAYAIATFPNSNKTQFKIISREKMMELKNKSKSTMFWGPYEDQMWKKTAVRNLLNFLPSSESMKKAALIEEETFKDNCADLYGEPQIIDIPNVQEIPDPDDPDFKDAFMKFEHMAAFYVQNHIDAMVAKNIPEGLCTTESYLLAAELLKERLPVRSKTVFKSINDRADLEETANLFNEEFPDNSEQRKLIIEFYESRLKEINDDDPRNGSFPVKKEGK